MTLTGTSARFELVANADITSQNSIGSAQIGTPLTAVTYSTAPDIAYSLSMRIQPGMTLALNLETGAVTGQVTGTNQVETATVVAASGITGNGNATVVFTSPLVVGSPLTVSVPVTTALTTATAVAGAIRTALQGVSAITAHYTIAGSGAAITATAIVKAANDTALNISTANGTCTGITTAGTSVNTTPGVAPSIATRLTGVTWDQTDFQGDALPTATKLYAIAIQTTENSIGTAIINNGSSDKKSRLDLGEIDFSVSKVGAHTWSADTVDFEAQGDEVFLTIDIHAGT